MMSSARSLFLAALVATVTGAALQARAADTVPADSGSQIEEVIVTAQKRSQSINDVPISITAASGDELVGQGLVSTADLARIVPGLTAQPTGYGVPVYTMRGVGFYDTALSAAPAVAVYTDEVPLPYSAMTKAAGLDVERVEVLKGPQGILFGENTTGGAINYIANKPTDRFVAGVDASLARFNATDIQGFASGPLQDGLNARFALRLLGGGAWQQSQSRPETLGDQRELQGRLLLDWSASDKLKFGLNINGWVDRSDTQAVQLEKARIAVPGSPIAPAILAQPPAPADDRAAEWDVHPGFGPLRHDDYFVQGAVRASYAMTDTATLTSITAAERYKTASNYDYDGTTLNISMANVIGTIDTVSQELRLSGTAKKLTYVVGGNVEYDRTYDQLQYQFPDATTSTIGPYHLTQTGNYTRQNVTTEAAFGHLEWEFAPDLTAEAGVRFTNTRRSFEGCSLDLSPPYTTSIVFNFLEQIFRKDGGFTPVGPGECWTFGPGVIPYAKNRLHNHLDEDNVSWRTGLSYKTPNRGLVYATISKGYKAGSFPTGASTEYTQYDPVHQESVLAYEAGFKQPMLDNHLQLNGAAFFYDYRDKQLHGRVVDPVFGPLDTLVQIPKSRVYGVEGQIIARPSANYTFNLAATYLNTRIQKFTGVNGAGVLEDYAGSRFPYAPKLQVVGDNQYDFGVRDGLRGFLGASVTYNSSTNSSIGYPSDYGIISYALLDVRAGIKAPDDSWRVQLWGRNVTNKYYYPNVVLFNDAIIKFAGRPATYGISYSRRF